VIETAPDYAVLPAFCRARILVLGVGNILFGDDGFGPEVAQRLTTGYEIPDDVCVLDVGTGARRVLFTVALSEARPEEILIVDAVDWGQASGEVFELSAEELPVTKIDDFSLHQVPTSNLLHDLEVECRLKVTVLACDVGEIPQMIAGGLSEQTENAVAVAVRQIAERFGLRPQPNR
jgi:coenzyme F420 hydrogenase subunit delta